MRKQLGNCRYTSHTHLAVRSIHIFRLTMVRFALRKSFKEMMKFLLIGIVNIVNESSENVVLLDPLDLGTLRLYNQSIKE